MKKDKWTKNLLTGKETVKSMIEQVYAVKIPDGTTIYTEPVGYQGGMYLEQVFIQEPWKNPGVTIMKYPK